MKICTTQGLIAILFTGMTLAYTGHAQVLDHEISVNVQHAPLEDLLAQISTQTAVYFSYSPELINISGLLTYKADRKSLRSVLDHLLSTRNIFWQLQPDGTTIALKRVDISDRAGKRDMPKTTILEITGTVVDKNNSPLPGVSIIVKGTSRGTTTDSFGRYALTADAGEELVFSFIGYKSVTVRISNATALDVTLEEDAAGLKEVVINVGYWQVRQKEQTGSVGRVTADQISRQPVTNALQAMQGRLTGVYIQQNTGVPGGGFTVQIRGQNSLRNSNTSNGNLPLYLIDGIPFTPSSLTSGVTSSANLRGGNPLASINPADIESIQVLKDADGTSIYGSRGANGVVVITTKKAQPGKPSLNIDFSSGIGKVTRFMDLLSTKDYLAMRREAITNDGYADFIGDPTLDALWPDLTVWDSTRYTNWQRKLIGGTAHISNTQASLSGGDNQTRYFVGGSYYKESTVFPGANDFQRATGRMTISHTSRSGKFNLVSTVNYTGSWSDIPATDFALLAVTLAPNAPAVRNKDGQLNWENSSWTNPLSQLERKYTNRITNLVTQLTAAYELFPGFTAKTDLGYTAMTVNELRLSPLSAYDPADLAGRTGASTFGDSKINTWIIEPQLEYKRQIAQGYLSVLGGATLQQSVQEGNTIEATGYTNDALLENRDAAPSVSVAEASYAQYRYAAFFARLNYIWKEKWLLNLTGRRDGSSRFGPGRQFGNFGAIGAGWIFSSEPVLKGINEVLSFGKLRTSYGTTGSDAIGNYQFLETYTATQYPYNGSTGLLLSRLGNADYSWETNRKFEVALDLGFFRDRLMLSAAFYLNRSGNQLVGLPLPVMTGQSTIQFNLPAEVENKGWEFQLTSMNMQHDDFEWSTDINATFPRNTLVNFPDINDFPSYRNRYEVGRSVYSYKALVFDGVDPQTGVYGFVDRNEDGEIGTDDIRIVDKTGQTAYGGINNSFRYKSFRFDFFVQVVRQQGFNYMSTFDFPGTMSNQPAQVMDRWQSDGETPRFQKFSAFDPDGSVSLSYANALYSNRAIVDASFVRLKNVSVSYELPEKWAAKAKLQSARIYLLGQNLLTSTRYAGLDPETQNAAAIPPLMTITAGVQLKF